MPPDRYGESYAPHCLEIYRLYVQGADRISDRRQASNSFFLSINTALTAFMGYVSEGTVDLPADMFYIILSIAGILLCFFWNRLIRSYKDINSAKFAVIHEMEKELPWRPYDAEWEHVKSVAEGRMYFRFSSIEGSVSWVFAGLYVGIAILAIWQIAVA